MQKIMKGVSVVVGLLAWSVPVWAGRPLAVDDADPAGAGVVEVEAGVAFERDGDNEHAEVSAGLTYGMFEALEVGAGWGWQQDRLEDEAGRTERVDGAQDVGLGAKWQYLGEGLVIPGKRLLLA